jgi:oligopeptidase B
MKPPIPPKILLALWLLAALAACQGAPAPATPAAAPEAGLQAAVAPAPAATPAPAPADRPAPPVAKRVPHPLEAHGHVRADDYYWLRDREDPEVVAYLEAENAYTEAMTAHTAALREGLFHEIVARIPQVDESAPYRLDGYWYYRRFEEGEEYPVYARRKGSLEAPEEVMLDVPAMAEGHSFYAVAGLAVSPDGRTLAFAVDTVGRRKYTLRFKDLATGEMLPDELPEKTPNVAWAGDGKTVFYTAQHPETLRWYRIYRHVLGSDPATDVLVYEEPDEEFSSHVFRTKSREFLVIGSEQTESSEYRYLRADDPTGDFRVFLPREPGHEHSIDHAGGRFYVRTNDGAKNFRLASTPVDDTSRTSWTEVIPHRSEVYLGAFQVFRDHLVVAERRDGLNRLRVMPLAGRSDGAAGEDHYVGFDEPAYAAFLTDNHEYDSPTVRFSYSSMTTPWSVYDYDLRSRERTLVKRDEIGGGFDPALYRTERLYAPARDGRKVPVSIVYRAGAEPDGSRPLLLHGYGSYGATMDPSFSSARLSLIDRGFVYAIAHVRGGQVYGRDWYEDGRLLKKKNTFTDFIDAAEFLVAQGWADPERLYAQGGSAGGLLMGAVVNLRPDLWDGVVAQVPFVDVVTTMLDPAIPLTTGEYDEWGDPNDKTYYDYMLSYSPYDNVEAKAYPSLLVTTGLHDSQVQYWEPAKWVAKLRALKTDGHPLLLKTNMEAGHGGTTGRFKSQKETAFIYAFLLDLAGEG